MSGLREAQWPKGIVHWLVLRRRGQTRDSVFCFASYIRSLYNAWQPFCLSFNWAPAILVWVVVGFCVFGFFSFSPHQPDAACQGVCKPRPRGIEVYCCFLQRPGLEDLATYSETPGIEVSCYFKILTWRFHVSRLKPTPLTTQVDFHGPYLALQLYFKILTHWTLVIGGFAVGLRFTTLFQNHWGFILEAYH